MPTPARIAVVIPAWNEAVLIDKTLSLIPNVVAHIVVVDDASTDETCAKVDAVQDARVELVRHAMNRGVGAAIATGYRRAFEAGAQVAVVMGADAQMDPDDLETLLAPILSGDADYTKGDRLSHPDVLWRMPLGRWVGNQALSQLTRVATGLPVADSQCGYTAIGRDAWQSLGLDELWPRYGYPNDLLSRAAVAKLRVCDVTVTPIYAGEVSGIRPRHLLTSFPYVLARGLMRRVLHSAAPVRKLR